MAWLVEVIEPYINAGPMKHYVVIDLDDPHEAERAATTLLDASPDWTSQAVRKMNDNLMSLYGVNVGGAKLISSQPA